MKLVSLVIFLSAIYSGVSGQIDTSFKKTDLSKMETKKDVYLKKSRVQKTTAFVLLGLGTTSIVTGAMMMGTAKNNNFIIPTDSKTYDGAGLIFMGMLVDLASIPFFISASNNKNKGLYLFIKNEPFPKEMLAHIKQNSIPALALKWRL